MISQLGCVLSDRIAAIGPVGGLRYPTSCGDKVAVVTFHGTADPINPYHGGGPAYWQTGVEDALSGWSEHNGCSAQPYELPVSESVTKVKYVGCDSGRSVELYRIEGMGHQWPGSAVTIPEETFGPPNDEIIASRIMWRFLQRHRIN